MSTAAYELPVIAEAAKIMRDVRREAAIKDKAYRRFPIGQEAGRFLRALRWSDHRPNTLDSYETVLAAFALEHPDLTVEWFASPVGGEYIREFLDDRWGQSSAATRRHRQSVLRSFFQWQVDERGLAFNPVGKAKRGRRRTTERSAYPISVLLQLVAAQPLLRDQCALRLACQMGFRKDELRQLRVGEIDLLRDLITVHGKGGKVEVMPLQFPSLRAELQMHIRGRNADEYLLHPRHNKRKPYNPSSVHRWFKQCLDRAGLDERIKLHELRHSAGDNMWRTTGNIVLAQKLLRHESVGTTQDYLHPTREDLAEAMRHADEGWTSRA